MDDEAMASLRGWLTECRPPTHRTERCYGVLAHSTVTLYANDIDPHPIEAFPTASIVQVTPGDALSFSISFSDGSARIFRCANAVELQRWVCALSLQFPTEKVTIESFEIIRQIGEGSFGRVFAARKISSGVLYAIKEIRKVNVSSRARESRVIAERNILMQASHQFITKLHYAFQTKTVFYFVLEFVGGGDLRFHLDRGMELCPEQIRLYLAEIVIALQTLHKLGVIYRDLKPENILVDTSGHLKLADFGLARQIDNEGFSLCGTFEYLPPEMLRDGKQSFAVDWWAFGILAFRLHFGFLPYQHLNIKRLFDMILRNEPRFPRSADPVIREFIRELLVKDPEQRLGSPGKDITRHRYFDGLSWQKVAKMELQPPFVPAITRPEWIFNFDEAFTTRHVTDMDNDPESRMIEDFSFENPSVLASIVSFEDLRDSELNPPLVTAT
jgi:serine/threonine protein kinase